MNNLTRARLRRDLLKAAVQGDFADPKSEGLFPTKLFPYLDMLIDGLERYEEKILRNPYL